jgi:hypothetical protein
MEEEERPPAKATMPKSREAEKQKQEESMDQSMLYTLFLRATIYIVT